jgi:hypothetical protein
VTRTSCGAFLLGRIRVLLIKRREVKPREIRISERMRQMLCVKTEKEKLIMKRRYLALLLALIMGLTLTLVACGGSGGGGGGGGSSSDAGVWDQSNWDSAEWGS